MKKLMMVAVAALFVGAFAHAEDTAKSMDSKETTTSADGASKTTEKHAHKGAHGKMKHEKTMKKDADGATKTTTETSSAPADAPATK